MQMNRKQLVAWCLCMVGQMLGSALYIRFYLRKPNTRKALRKVIAGLDELRDAITKEYTDS